MSCGESFGRSSLLGFSALACLCSAAFVAAPREGVSHASEPVEAPKAAEQIDRAFKLMPINPALNLSDATNQALGLTASQVVSLDLPAVPAANLQFEIPINGKPVTLALNPHSVRDPLYKVLAQVADGSYVEVEPQPLQTMRGTVAGEADSIVAGSIDDEGFRGTIRIAGQRAWWVEPIHGRVPGAAVGQHVVYSSEAMIPSGGTCELMPEAGQGPQLEFEGGVSGGPCAGNYIAQLACDADVEYFNRWGSVAGVENRINAVINAMNAQYEDEVNITHDITTIIVRTAEPDPYSQSGASSLLNQFRSHWLAQQGGVVRDVAQLFTGRNLSGTTIGIAFNIGAICNSNAYCLVQSDCCGPFGCSTDLSAHEMGHLWDAPHCTCNGSGSANDFTMHPSILCANQHHPTLTIPVIIAYRDTRECLSCEGAGPGPANNNCSSAMAISEGSFPFSTVDASTDGPSESSCAFEFDPQIGSDIWYRFQASCTGTATASLCGSSYNTKMAVYGSACPTGGSQVIACNDDFDCNGDGNPNNDGFASSVSWPVTENSRYLIRIGGQAGAEGAGTLNVSCLAVEPPSNDECADATVVGTGATAFTTVGATSGGPTLPISCIEDQAIGESLESDIWYEFAATCNGTLTVRTCNFADFDTRLAVYTGADCGAMTLVGCNDDLPQCSDFTSLVSVAGVTCGQVFKIRLGSHTGLQGTGTLIVGCGPAGTCAPSPCTGDLVNDGTVDGIDLGALLAAWSLPAGAPGCGGTQPCIADLDSNGVVDGIDLGMLLFAFGPCPK